MDTSDKKEFMHLLWRFKRGSITERDRRHFGNRAFIQETRDRKAYLQDLLNLVSKIDGGDRV